MAVCSVPLRKISSSAAFGLVTVAKGKRPKVPQDGIPKTETHSLLVILVSCLLQW